MTLKIIKTNSDWLEATWVDNGIQIHCESFSGHPEHIQMLRDRCMGFGTELTVDDEKVITEISEAFIPVSQEELDRLGTEQKVAEAKHYLSSTDFKMTVDYYYTLAEAEQVELTSKRAEAREFIRLNEVE